MVIILETFRTYYHLLIAIIKELKSNTRLDIVLVAFAKFIIISTPTNYDDKKIILIHHLLKIL